VSNDLGWSAGTSFDEVCRRAAGRRHYNSWRALLRRERRLKVLELLCRYGMFEHGVLGRIAVEMGVSRSTICRDRQSLAELAHPCPHCDKPVPPEFVDRVWVGHHARGTF
jgi:hypothetical protein